jgi:hypothetical protein
MFQTQARRGRFFDLVDDFSARAGASAVVGRAPTA